MAMQCRGRHIFSPIQVRMKSNLLKEDNISVKHKFTRARIPQELLDERAQEHEKYGGNPEQPSKQHAVTRVSLLLLKYDNWVLFPPLIFHCSFSTQNIPSVNNQLKCIKVQPLKLPHGLPTEEDMADTYLNSKGELIVRRLRHVGQ
uniref:Uncharacterized protein n=1 Tax=Hucho hucho TaxID=62062 RepID=A0A4W5Q3G6_9TELE